MKGRPNTVRGPIARHRLCGARRDVHVKAALNLVGSAPVRVLRTEHQACLGAIAIVPGRRGSSRQSRDPTQDQDHHAGQLDSVLCSP